MARAFLQLPDAANQREFAGVAIALIRARAACDKALIPFSERSTCLGHLTYLLGLPAFHDDNPTRPRFFSLGPGDALEVWTSEGQAIIATITITADVISAQLERSWFDDRLPAAYRPHRIRSPFERPHKKLK